MRSRFDGATLTTVHGPRYRMLVIGAGQLSKYLAQIAVGLDYQVTVCDPREEYTETWDIAGITLVKTMPDDTVIDMKLDERCAVVALTHDPKLDDLALMEALKSPAFYVGALGSRANNAKRRKRLEEFDLTPEQIARLHGPIGLYIGSRTPPEIAVSILAEITAVKNGVEVPDLAQVADAKEKLGPSVDLCDKLNCELAMPRERASFIFRSHVQRGFMPPQLLLRAPMHCRRTSIQNPLFLAAALALSCALACGLAQAQSPPPADAATEQAADPWRTDRFYLETSLYTVHFHSDPEPRQSARSSSSASGTSPSNGCSARRFSTIRSANRRNTIYGGWSYRPFGLAQPFYLKVSAGLVHGYKDQYRDKIPFNHSGIAPAIVPSVGYCFGRVCSEVVVFGGAGLLWTLGVTIP